MSSTLVLAANSVPKTGYKLPVNEAIDLGDYTQLALQLGVNNLNLGTNTTMGTVKLFHSARLRAADFKEISGQSYDFAVDETEIHYVVDFARFVLITFEWDHEDGGSADFEALVVPKR